LTNWSGFVISGLKAKLPNVSSENIKVFDTALESDFLYDDQKLEG
jgi:hypothetical protein